MAFVWDNEKAASNERKHGISFQFAARVFQSDVQVEWIDDKEDYGEERLNVIGLIDGEEVFVCYTVRGLDVRILSARKVTRDERKRYWAD